MNEPLGSEPGEALARLRRRAARADRRRAAASGRSPLRCFRRCRTRGRGRRCGSGNGRDRAARRRRRIRRRSEPPRPLRRPAGAPDRRARSRSEGIEGERLNERGDEHRRCTLVRTASAPRSARRAARIGSSRSRRQAAAKASAVSAVSTGPSLPASSRPRAPTVVATTGRRWARASRTLIRVPPPARIGTTATAADRYQGATSGTSPATVTRQSAASSRTSWPGRLPTSATVGPSRRGSTSRQSQRAPSAFGR